ncbi:MAG: hypothetical protein M9898_15295 [Chitinophagaceae bacterium]|nr:hypothetical protein [Chitinophagaceae bacterium]
MGSHIRFNDISIYILPLWGKDNEKQFALTKQLKEKALANQQATEQLLKALLYPTYEPA